MDPSPVITRVQQQGWHARSAPAPPLPLSHSAELNSLLIAAMVTVGSYQGLCNMYRVFFSFDHRSLAPEVGAVAVAGPFPPAGWAVGAWRCSVRPCGSCRRAAAQLSTLPNAPDATCNRLFLATACVSTVFFSHSRRPSLWLPTAPNPTQSRTPQEAGHKQLGVKAAWAHFIAITAQLALSAVWLWGETSTPYLCRAQNVSIGLVYALMASQLIMAHMCKEPFKPPLWAIFGMAAAAANSRWRRVDPLLLTSALDVVFLLGYLHYVVSVINQICGFLGINCLTLKRPAQPAAALQPALAGAHTD